MSENTMPSQTSWENDPSPLPNQPDPSENLHETASETEPDTVTLRRSHLYAMLLPLAFVIGLSVGYIFWGRNPVSTVAQTSGATAQTNPATGQENSVPTTGQNNPQGDAAETDPQEIVRYDVPVDDDPYYGPENAPITIIEFSDYECPFCRKWHVEVYSRLVETYPGQIKFVYRDFPLTNIHPDAFPAAEAASCAGDQGVYWPYHELLFGMEFGLGQDAYRQYAEQLGINMEKFNSCLEEGKFKEEIQADFEYAAQLGVRSTPTFFINGIAVVGAQSYEVFQQVIERELAGEIP